ncbi:MAG: sigma-70 family RNA polymerase sigma factor [Candidatus Rokuibacteriota bacterium]|nr:MAG: sigma-70 family RNA polymerase sigma factor [Candidatus Rokubacteria bacterium]
MDAADAALFDRLRAGDGTALEPLMERFASRVYRVAHGVTGNAADAEEVVQDVFLTLFRKAASFEGRAALGTWLYRIAVNTALNKRRGKRSQVEEPLEDHLPQYTADGHREGDRSFLLADWSQMPDEVLLSREGRGIVRAAVECLPAHYRVVLVLRDVEELSSEEVAEIVGDSIASVKSRLHRARMALREQLTRTYASEHPPAAIARSK